MATTPNIVLYATPSSTGTTTTTGSIPTPVPVYGVPGSKQITGYNTTNNDGSVSFSPYNAPPPPTNSAPGQPGTTSTAPSATSAAGSAGPAGQPQTEDQIYESMLHQGNGVIDALNASKDAAIKAANIQYDTAASTQQQNQNAVAAITGGFGSSAAGGAGQIAGTAATQKAGAAATIQAQTQQQIAQYLTSLQSLATSQANTESEDYYKNAVPQANSIVQGLVKNGLTFDQLSTNPALAQTYQQLLGIYGNDPNAVAAQFAMQTPTANVVQSWAQGSTYYQIVRDPNTNAVSLQQFTLPVAPPVGWTSTKVSTTTTLFQDPSNPQNSLVYTTDPLTGQVQVTGTGTGQQIASQYTSSPSNSGSPSPSSTGTASASGTNYINTVANAAGVADPSIPLSSAIAANGVGSIVAGIIKAEGGSLPGVSNNPGNIKFSGLPGQTDSGVKATDGGTFASYATPDAGNEAIASLITNAAAGASQAYGQNPTLQSFLSTYANLGGTSSAGTGSNGLPTAQYGLLANVSDFDPGSPGQNQTNSQVIDQGAFNYLKSYLSGQTPSTSGGMGGLSAKVYNSDIQARANQLYTEATGQHLPNADQLSANLGLIAGNNAMLNSLGINAPTISANAKLLEGKITAANINQNAPVINAIIDPVIQALGNPAVAAYVAQSSTLQNELGSLLALKGASGSGAATVHDKLVAAGLIEKSANAAQISDTVNTILQEAANAQSAISTASMNLYLKTDPMQIDPANPLNSSSPLHFTDASGNSTSFDPGSLSSTDVSALLQEGYSLE